MVTRIERTKSFMKYLSVYSVTWFLVFVGISIVLIPITNEFNYKSICGGLVGVIAMLVATEASKFFFPDA